MSKISISKIRFNPNNPRIIKDDKFEKLIQSIRNFPYMLELRPIVIDENNIVLGGNMRLKALRELGYKEVSVVLAKDLTEEQKKEFIIKDNLGFGEWNWDTLTNDDWDSEKLQKWGLDIPNFEGSEDDISDKITQAYKIEIACDNEAHQEKLYNELMAKGLNCRLLSL